MSYILESLNQIYPEVVNKFLLLEENVRTDDSLMDELASHIVDAYESGKEDEVRPAFEFAEQLMVDGSASARNLAVIGFLETVQNVASHRACGMEAFEKFLGSASVKAWAELHKIWEGKTHLAQVVAAENGNTQFKLKSKLTPREMLEKVTDPILRKLIEQSTREHPSRNP